MTTRSQCAPPNAVIQVLAQRFLGPCFGMKVISLTTIPSRMPHIRPTLDSLLDQRTPFDQVNLYIPKHYRRFPDYDGTLPDLPDGVTIRVVDEDFGPASKVLHAVRELRVVE